ncbi:MAG: hypothetical protein J6Q38_04150, partial [Clostridia bacterium]|nr:hypothetical protein [Clostridia bacterium]
MKKRLSVSILSILLAITSVFGFASLKPTAVNAAESITSDFALVGAGLRKDDAMSEFDVMGIRFETSMTQKAYNAILDQAGDNVVTFGTRISVDGKDGVIDLSYVSSNPEASNESAGKNVFMAPSFASEDEAETYSYFATVTYDVDELIAGLIASGKVQEGATSSDPTVQSYLSAAYSTLMQATSYYEINGTKRETKSMVRSMAMVANHYVQGGALGGDDIADVVAKNYFYAVEETITGLYLELDTGKIVDSIGASYELSANQKIAYEANYLPYKDGVLDLTGYDFTSSLASDINFYLFDLVKDGGVYKNTVKSLVLKCVSKTISTASDFSYFEVKYNFDQTYYDSLVKGVASGANTR